MTLLITVLAAIVVTVFWYRQEEDTMMLSTLLFLFWGASIMWFVDALFEFVSIGAAYFTPSLEEMANDLFLGVSEVALALLVWLIRLLYRDPKDRIRRHLRRAMQ